MRALPVAILISESIARKEFAGQDPIGQRVPSVLMPARRTDPGPPSLALWAKILHQRRRPALIHPGAILDGIVKQRRNGLVLRSAVLEDKRADSEQVRHIGRSRRLPLLRPMYLARKHQRSIEAFRQGHTRATARFHPANRFSRWSTVISGSKIFSARQNCSTSSVFFQMPVARPAR